jgi:hypothetical protein
LQGVTFAAAFSHSTCCLKCIVCFVLGR